MSRENCFSYYDETSNECQQCRIKNACRIVQGKRDFEDQLKTLLKQGRYSMTELRDMFWLPASTVRAAMKKLGARKMILYKLSSNEKTRVT